MSEMLEGSEILLSDALNQVSLQLQSLCPCSKQTYITGNNSSQWFSRFCTVKLANHKSSLLANFECRLQFLWNICAFGKYLDPAPTSIEMHLRQFHPRAAWKQCFHDPSVPGCGSHLCHGALWSTPNIGTSIYAPTDDTPCLVSASADCLGFLVLRAAGVPTSIVQEPQIMPLS